MSAQYKVHFEMKSSHSHQDKCPSVVSRSAVGVRDVIYGLTSPYCTAAHPEVMMGNRGGLQVSGDQDKCPSVVATPPDDVRDVIYGLTSPDCTTAHPGAMKGDCGGLQDSGDQDKCTSVVATPSVEVNKLLLAAGLKGSIRINDDSYCFKIRTMTGLRTRILHHILHSKGSDKTLKNKAKRKHSKEQKLNCIPTFESNTVKKMDTTQKNYFAGVRDTSNLIRLLDKNNVTEYRINLVHIL
jgi:hypothetical protein